MQVNAVYHLATSLPKANARSSVFKMEQKLAEAYASGDTDAILRLLNGEPSSTSLFPQADSSVTQALALSHRNDASAAEASLSDLEGLGPLSAASTSPDAPCGIDTHAYAKAVQEFNNDFPTLGGAPAARPAPQPYGGGDLLARIEEQALTDEFPWVRPPDIAALRKAVGGDVQRARTALGRRFPRPPGWQDDRRARAEAAERDAILKATASMRLNSYEDEGSAGGTRWTGSGESVSRLYAEKRASAFDAVRERNKYFEMAAEKARTGRGAEAARLGALGRKANEKMKALHEEAAERLWEENNASFVTDELVDLHGLHVVEALDRLPKAFAQARAAGVGALRVVFGTGHHSKGGGGAPRLRPAVTKFLAEEGYSFEEMVDKKTKFISGVLVSLYSRH